MALDHSGTFHSKLASGMAAVLGRLIWTLLPVALMVSRSTSPASAVAQSLAIAPPPVSSARKSPVRWSYQRGLMTQLYFPPSSSRFWGLGIVVWFHGCL